MKGNFSPSSFIAGTMIGVIFTSVWFFNDNETEVTPTPLSILIEDTKPLLSTLDSGAVSVSDQVHGSKVIVESVTVPPPGVWIAVRETIGDELGNILGATLVGGPRSNVSIALLRDTLPGKRYAVQLYRDDGDDAFDLATDSVYIDFDTGSRVVVFFQTTE